MPMLPCVSSSLKIPPKTQTIVMLVCLLVNSIHDVVGLGLLAVSEGAVICFFGVREGLAVVDRVLYASVNG